MDELFEALTLIQTGKVKQFPGGAVRRGVLGGPGGLAARDRGRRAARSTRADLDLFHVTDDPAEAVRIVVAGARQADGVHHPQPRVRSTA